MSGWVAGAVVVGSLVSANASSKASKAQAASADRATELQRDQFTRQTELQEPWRQAGITALNKLTPLATEYTPFGMQQFQQDPGYSFRMAEGMKGLERSAAARGGLLSGATLRGIQRYGQDLASQEYQNAFNRYQTERNARLNPLQSLAGVGQTATNALGAAGQNYANAAGEAGMQAANARASGYVGTANAINQGMGTYMNYSQGNNLVNALRGSSGYGGTSAMGPQYGQQPLDSSFDQYLAR